jgi:hypothetical protein
MKSVFAVIFDSNEDFLVGKRYDTDQSYFFLGGTYYSDEDPFDTIQEKVIEKSSGLLHLEQGEYYDVFYLTDNNRKIKLQLVDQLENKDNIYLIFSSDESFHPFISEWRTDFQENQIRIVNKVINKIREITPYISFLDWIHMIVVYKGRYRQSNSFRNLLRKRGVRDSEIKEIIQYLELLDVYIRFQNLSLVKYDELKSSNGLTERQRDFFRF